MFSFIHASDIHLDSPLIRLEHYEGAPCDALRQASRRAFDRLIDMAIDEATDFVIISGDLYDGSWKDYHTGLYFTSRMARLREADIPVFIVAGNHDAASKMTRCLKLPANVNFFANDRPETIYLKNPDVAIHGQSFATRAVKKDLSAAYPNAASGCYNIGLLHTSVSGREGHAPYAPCSVSGLVDKEYDYWALGHVHKNEIVYKNPWIVFPGNIQGRHIMETGPKGCVKVSVDYNGKTSVDFRDLDVIRWQKLEIDLKEIDHIDDAITTIGDQVDDILEKNEGPPVIIRIEASGSGKAHMELGSDPEHWVNEIRSNSIDSSGGQIWIEKLKIKNSIHNGANDKIQGPIEEILHYIDEIEKDPEQLMALADPIRVLTKKLPRELCQGQDGIKPDDIEWIKGMLSEVKPILIRSFGLSGDH
ncbi:DNA repair exonuclease [Desulfobacterales bacterium HSG16]|nr:DNA repair exonuclease [Desulfobacterales bacterium HSG16]